jgi:CubicO group peptidase (beta-lactamase class C family)
MLRRSIQLVSRGVDALRQINGWGAAHASAFVLRGGEPLATQGATDVQLRWASITKIVVGLAALVALEEGIVDLDEPAGPEGSTVRHLFAHASGLPFHGTEPIARPGTRRIYSNPGFEALAEHVAVAAEMPFAEYLRASVLGPLEMKAELRGSVASHLFGTLDDLVLFARELQSPTLVAPETFAEATSVQFPGLNGVLPGFGRWDPNDWGLGFELRDAKTPHWTGTRNSPRTFGHFGGSGTFLWVDPVAGLACGVLTDREFDDWALEAWPRLSDAVLEEAA